MIILRWDWVFWAVGVVVAFALMSQWWWQPRLPVWMQRAAKGGPWGWYLFGYPVTVVRMVATWRRLCTTADLTVVRRPRYTMIGKDQMVRGTSVRPLPPRLGLPMVTATGLTVRVHLHPGQTPKQFIMNAEVFTHGWRVHSVRVLSVRRGEVLIIATARNPLADSSAWGRFPAPRLLAAVVGRTEDGSPWVFDFRSVPHWLIAGATQSGKSTLLASLVTELGAQPVALVAIDCKGGMELGLFGRRLSALATSREEAVPLLSGILSELQDRMAACRSAGVRSVWDLPEHERPVPIVVIVDEVAELYLSGGSLLGRKDAVECSTLLLRIGQLGAALGVHLVIAAQRFGSELGPGATALRAQLAGRVCHRVNDEMTAEMVLGDLSPDAVVVAQTITETEKGVAVTTVGGAWMRARSSLVSPADARRWAEHNSGRTPVLPGLSRAMTSGGDTA
ncbi:FtsK/SpoIIIE domain-containing protein [Streptomyces sp. NPDC059479]|uniref:FtsK/SpoIIIE domain-containing protein n=1 Tax=Streptomyces sp. NPDC059479 TaxID=3346848 RepID=UPI00367476FB